MFLNNNSIAKTSYKNTGITAKLGLSPPEMMVGCFKTSSDPTYKYFSHGEFDELAMWHKRLPDGDVKLFLGGYGKHTLFKTFNYGFHLNFLIFLKFKVLFLIGNIRNSFCDNFFWWQKPSFRSTDPFPKP